MQFKLFKGLAVIAAFVAIVAIIQMGQHGELTAVALAEESSASSAGRCRVPAESIPMEKADSITPDKSWGWGKFRRVGTWVRRWLECRCDPGVDPARLCSTYNPDGRCRYVRHGGYFVSKDAVSANLPIRDIANGIRVDFNKWSDTWMGVYYSFRRMRSFSGLDGNWISGCGDLRKYKGLQFDLSGTAKLRVQLDEGPDRGDDDYGELYAALVLADPSARQTVRLPFDNFSYRTDWQPPRQNRVFLNRRLELESIRGITWEALCPRQTFDCGPQWFEISNVQLFE